MLTPEQIDLAMQQHVDPVATHGRLHNFARAIETEVRKQDTELIQQLVASLEGYRRNHNDGQPCDAEQAGRARLEHTP